MIVLFLFQHQTHLQERLVHLERQVPREIRVTKELEALKDEKVSEESRDLQEMKETRVKKVLWVHQALLVLLGPYLQHPLEVLDLVLALIPLGISCDQVILKDQVSSFKKYGDRKVLRELPVKVVLLVPVGLMVFKENLVN